MVSPRVAGVMPWWAEEGNLTETERRRLRTLRQDVYDLLEERQLVRKGPGQGSSVQVSLVDPGEVVEASAASEPEAVQEQLGAWVLKLSPYVYDASLVFSAPDRMVRRWSVDAGDRAARMRHGQPAYLWLGPGDPLREPGIWGVGWVMGAAVTGTPDAGWLDVEAANRASLFAVVEITLMDAPVSQTVFLQDSRLSNAEVIREPLAGNPGLLTPAEAAALAQYVGVSPALPEQTEAT